MAKRKRDHHLPKSVYKKHNRYYGAICRKQQMTRFTSATTPEEAEYNMLRERNGHHWRNMGDTTQYFGFIYTIENRKTGKMYGGCKQLEKWAGPPNGYKVYDKTDPDYDPLAWKESGWEFYTSSSDPLNEEMAFSNVWDYKFTVVKMCTDILDLHISETLFLMEHDVLQAKGADGEYLWYNKNIAGKAFRAPVNREEALLAEAKSRDAMRNYYLKPKHHADGTIIPFEKVRKEPAKPEVVVTPRPFNDVR